MMMHGERIAPITSPKGDCGRMCWRGGGGGSPGRHDCSQNCFLGLQDLLVAASEKSKCAVALVQPRA